MALTWQPPPAKQLINASNCSRAALVNALGTANDGDTILIPNGTASDWTSNLTITKGVRIMGNTTIQNPGLSTCSATDKAILINNSSSPMISVSINANQQFELRGLTFQSGSGGQFVTITSTGSAAVTQVRVNNCHFNQPAGASAGNLFHISGWTYGVADHNFIELLGGSQCFLLDQGTIRNGIIGEGAWDDYPWFGTDKFWFIEDNTIHGGATNGTPGASATTDGNQGSRFVVRHNYLWHSRPGWHGTEGNGRGVRAVEVYNNLYHWTVGGYSASYRSGSCLFHDNTWDANASGNDIHISMQAYRCNGGGVSNQVQGSATTGNVWSHWASDQTVFPGGADGDCAWDANDTTGTGVYEDQEPVKAGFVHYSGTAASTTAGAPGGGSGNGVVTVTPALPASASTWVADGRFYIRQENPAKGFTAGGSYPKAGPIVGVSGNTITFGRYPSGDRGPTLNFETGDKLAVHRLLIAMDQPTRGKGDFCYANSQNSAINQVTNSRHWPHQALEPALSWNNAHTGGNAQGFGVAATPTLQLGRDYYNLGTGHLTDGTIPASYTGPVYNAALNGSTYTGPFTYPHPIADEGPVTPRIDSTNTTFTVGVSGQEFQVLTSNFASTPVFTTPPTVTSAPITPLGLPSGVTFSSGGKFTGAGTISSAVAGTYVMTLATTTPSVVSATFTLKINAGNQAPTVSLTSPTEGQTFSAPATISLQANASDADGTIASVEYYRGATLIGAATVNSPPYTLSWTNVPVGNYAITAKATDDLSASTTSSPAVNITVSTGPPGTLAAPNIVVYAGGSSSATPTTLNFGFSYPNFTGATGAMTQSQYVGVFAAAMHNPPPYLEWINAGKDIRLLNPAGAYLKHLNVRTLDASFETSEGHPDHLYIQNNHPEWIIRNAAGNTVPLFRPSEQSLDFGNSAYLDWVFGTWMPNSYFDSTEQSAVVTYYEHDNGQIKGMASQFGLACAVGDTVCQKYLTDAGVQTAFKNLFDKFHQYHPNRKIFLSTGLASESQGDLAALEDVLSHADGYYSEYLTNDLAYWNSGTNASKRTILNNTLLLADWCATNDKYFYPVLGQSDVAQPTQAQINYAYAFFNLFRAGVKQFFGFILINGSGQWQPAAIPEMSLPLGDLTETRQQISTDVWRRTFANAIAYVNISDTSTSIPLPTGTWKNSLGTTVSSPLVLQSFSGLTVYA